MQLNKGIFKYIKVIEVCTCIFLVKRLLSSIKHVCMSADGCVCLMNWLCPPYLCDEYVGHSVDGVIPVIGCDEVLSPAFFEAG